MVEKPTQRGKDIIRVVQDRPDVMLQWVREYMEPQKKEDGQKG